jgi:hypothetical protein
MPIFFPPLSILPLAHRPWDITWTDSEATS